MKKETHIQKGDFTCYIYYHRNRIQRRVYYEIKKQGSPIDSGMLELADFLHELEHDELFQLFDAEDFAAFANYIRERIATYWEIHQDGRNYYVEIHKELGKIDIWEDVSKAAVTEAGTRLELHEFMDSEHFQEVIEEFMGADILQEVLKKVKERL